MAKPRKRRTLTPEQKAAAVERLAKAREKRNKENPPEHKSIHPDALNRPENDPFYFRKVQGWIKIQKELLSEARKELKTNPKGGEAKVLSIQKYINNLEKFLREGVYVDMFYGPHQENKIRYRCIHPAYDSKTGEQKRSYGVFYQDLGYTYTGLDYQEEAEA